MHNNSSGLYKELKENNFSSFLELKLPYHHHKVYLSFVYTESGSPFGLIIKAV